MNGSAPLPRHLGIYGPAETGVPAGAMLILDDRGPGRHDPAQIAAMVQAMRIERVLLDFEQMPQADSIHMADALFQALGRPVAAPPGYLEDPACPVFLPPCPLHVPLEDYLRPHQDREIWLDMTMQRQTVTVTPDGTRCGSPAPADRQDGGWFDETLLCRCMTAQSDDLVQFILFDTPETLNAKMNRAAALGVTRAVGLYQEWHRIGGCIFRDGGLI